MHLRFLPKDHLVTGGNDLELIFVELHKGVDARFWVVRTVVGLNAPKIVVKDEDGALIRKSPSEFGIEERVVRPMGSVDVQPVETGSFSLGRFLEEGHQAWNAELFDHPERATREGEVVEYFFVTLFSGWRGKEVEVVDTYDSAAICTERRGQEEGGRTSLPGTNLEDPGVGGMDERYEGCPERNITRETVLGLGESVSL